MWYGHFEQRVRQDPRFGRWYVRYKRQPSWVDGAALAAVVLVVVVPLVLLVLAALVVGLVVYLILGLVAGVLGAIGRVWRSITGSDSQGRRNVRVVEPEQWR